MKFKVRFSSLNYGDHYASQDWAFYPAALPLPKPVEMDLANALETMRYLLNAGATWVIVEKVK